MRLIIELQEIRSLLKVWTQDKRLLEENKNALSFKRD